MIAALIKNYGEIGALGTFILIMAWYLWHQTRCQSKREDKHDSIQKEERIFYRNLVTNDMKELHENSVKNAELNVQGIELQKEMIRDFKEHNGHSKEFSEKIIESLNNICDKLSIVGGRRKISKEIETERRK